jgi:hypothetical protein
MGCNKFVVDILTSACDRSKLLSYINVNLLLILKCMIVYILYVPFTQYYMLNVEHDQPN